MQWVEHSGRIFEPIEKFQRFLVQPWQFGKKNEIKPNIIYHIGHTTPVGYWGRISNEYKQPSGLFIRRSLSSNNSIYNVHGLALGVFYWDEQEKFSEWHYFRDEYEQAEYVHKKTCEFIVNRGKNFSNLSHLIFGNYFMDDYNHHFYNVELFHELLENFPQVEHLLVRGGFGHSPSTHREKTSYSRLKTLSIQTFGLSDANLNQIITTCDFPNLIKLELYLGTEFYNGMKKLGGLTNLFAGKYPSLKHLSLLDSDKTDEIAYEIAHSSIIKQLDSLDLSFGTLTDEGADVLLNSPKINSLKNLNFRSNHLTADFIDEISRRKLGVSINTIEQKGNLEERYWMIRE